MNENEIRIKRYALEIALECLVELIDKVQFNRVQVSNQKKTLNELAEVCALLREEVVKLRAQ